MLPRRELLCWIAGGSAAALVGCDGLLSAVSRHAGADLPGHLEPAAGTAIDPAHHLLNRAAFGPWPGDLARVHHMGPGAWIDEQLNPDAVSDTACTLRTSPIDTIAMHPGLTAELRPEHIEQQLISYTLLQAVYSRRQLHEVMTAFWSDHFNIAIRKSLCRFLKTQDDREVIRRHALGSFSDLLRASALSPAMLVYLDGRENRVDRAGDRPNENFARELLELHTLGVDGGYTQRDVMEAARCLSGWVVREKWTPGKVDFVPERHDDGDKVVLNQRISAGGGASDLDRLLSIVVEHPSCAQFIARKLCQHFVGDDVAESLIAQAARTFSATRGDIRAMVRGILTSQDFLRSAGKKVKRPFRFVVSALRALAADTRARAPLLRTLERLGQVPFQHPTPDGYPTEAKAWLGTLLWRWKFALDLSTRRIDDTTVDLPKLLHALDTTTADPVVPLFRHLMGRNPTSEETEPIRAYLAKAGKPAAEGALSLLLSSPGYQFH